MAAYKEFLRKSLLDNSYGIYSKILDAYRDQMAFLKTPSLFRKWLADELDVPIEKINLNSLNSVLKRQRNKGKTRQETFGLTKPPSNDNQGKIEKFQFSIPSSDDKQPSRITEL
jgi:hypothetical protein